jgi:hypothetical protein
MSQLGRLDSLTRRHPNGRDRAQTRCQRQPVQTAGSGGDRAFADTPSNGEVAPKASVRATAIGPRGSIYSRLNLTARRANRGPVAVPEACAGQIRLRAQCCRDRRHQWLYEIASARHYCRGMICAFHRHMADFLRAVSVRPHRCSASATTGPIAKSISELSMLLFPSRLRFPHWALSSQLLMVNGFVQNDRQFQGKQSRATLCVPPPPLSNSRGFL